MFVTAIQSSFVALVSIAAWFVFHTFLLMWVPAQYVSVTERHAERKLEHRNRDLNFTVSYLEIDASSEAELEPVTS